MWVRLLLQIYIIMENFRRLSELAPLASNRCVRHHKYISGDNCGLVYVQVAI